MPYLGNTVGNRFVASKAATQFSGDGSTTAFTLAMQWDLMRTYLYL